METYRTEQRPASNIEVLHIGDFDVAVNRDTDHPELAEKALDLIRQNQDSEIETIPWKENGMYLKKRTKVDWYLRAKHEPNPMRKRIDYSFSSLLNEIRLSPRIKELIQSHIINTIVKEYGFERMIFVGPVLGFVDRNTSRDENKYMVYPFVKGILADEIKGDSFQIMSRTSMITKNRQYITFRRYLAV